MLSEADNNRSIDNEIDVKTIVLKRHEVLLTQMLIQPIIFRTISLILFITTFFISFNILGLLVYISFTVNSSLFWWINMQIVKGKTSSLEAHAFRKKLTFDSEVWRTIYIEAEGDEVSTKTTDFIERMEPIMWTSLIVLSATVKYLQ